MGRCMANWVVSLLGIVVITLVCDVILPPGQTAKYIKTVISIIVVCAIVFPLVKVVKNMDINVFLDSAEIGYQQSYIEYIKGEKSSQLAVACDKLLKENALNGCSTVVSVSDELDVAGVCVTIEPDYYNQLVVEKITKLILSVVSVEASEVSCVVQD